jgi:hypothetical protein
VIKAGILGIATVQYERVEITAFQVSLGEQGELNRLYRPKGVEQQSTLFSVLCSTN